MCIYIYIRHVCFPLKEAFTNDRKPLQKTLKKDFKTIFPFVFL